MRETQKEDIQLYLEACIEEAGDGPAFIAHVLLMRLNGPVNWQKTWNQAITTKLHDYDVAKHLRTPEEMAAYLEAAIEDSDGDAAFIAMALGYIARANPAA